MRTLYLECAMGAAGDMLMAALYELCPEKKQFLTDMNRLAPGVRVMVEQVKRQGMAGTHMRVVVHGREEGRGGHIHDHGQEHAHDHAHGHHHHVHRTLADMEAVIDSFALPEAVRRRAKEVYGRIAQAEARSHGTEVGEVHFHEVGALDAAADVAGVCYLMHLLSAERVICSPVTVGFGTVSTAHGVLPVPAPATAALLEGIPISTGDIQAELCTPTGAALLRAFAEDFGPMPAGRLLAVGHGCGTKDFPRPNLLRALLLETAEGEAGPNDAVTELKANIDDMTGEALGFAMERLLEAGALDVSYLPIQMKKNRPGVLLICLCRPADADRLAAVILRETTTIGVRRLDCSRYALETRVETEETAWGPLKWKVASGYGVEKRKVEYEDAATMARARGVPLAAAAEGPGREG